MLHIDESADLRNVATPPFEPALPHPIPPGVTSLYGSNAPFGSPAFAMRDALDITAASATQVADPIPGWRVRGSLWPSQRYLLRVPRAWNGRLVVAGCPGQRTEFASDRLFGDALLARGYAYVCGNKGNGDGAIVLDPGADIAIDDIPLPRFPIPGGRAVAFWQHAPGHVLERWLDEIVDIAEVARESVQGITSRAPEVTYAIGLSNGGYQVRRAIEESDAFDGALTWNAVMWSAQPCFLDALAEAIAAMECGEPDRLIALGFPPNAIAKSGNGSLYQKNLFLYWYVTLWLHAAQIDPEMSIAYGDVTDRAMAESWCVRISQWRTRRSPIVAQRIERFANTGAIRCKLIDVASEFDHLIPPRLHFDPYRDLVAGLGKSHMYRGYVVSNAQHVDAWADDPEYPQMSPGLPAVMSAWDELTAWVEGGPVKSL